MKKIATRRDFIRLSALGLGSLSIAAPAKKPIVKMLTIPDALIKPLKIICAGAHPGDPEFGCGGSMAKYSAAGHKVIFLYITRGEAYDTNKTHLDTMSRYLLFIPLKLFHRPFRRVLRQLIKAITF